MNKEPSHPGLATPPPQSPKILVLIGLPYSDGYWHRDSGLIARSLRAIGADAWLVGFGEESQNADTSRPVITAPREMLEDPAWWKAQSPYGVVLTLWGSSRFEKIRAAAIQATPRVIEKLDTDGVKSPRVWLWEHIVVCRMHLIDHGKCNRLFAPFVAVMRSLGTWAFPALLDKKLTAGLSRVPVVAAECPVAVERVRRWIRTMGFESPTMACIPHPVDETDIRFDPSVPRGNKIVAVGRWTTEQKNLPLLLEVLNDFLARHPDWSAEIVGQMPKDIDNKTLGIPKQILSRINMPGLVQHEKLAWYYQSSKIYLLTSRHEGFCNTVSESLCCGCSVVGPADASGIVYVASYASGTISCRKSKYHLLDALYAEVEAWKDGWRDPQKIAQEWSGKLGARAVAEKILQTLGEIPV